MMGERPIRLPWTAGRQRPATQSPEAQREQRRAAYSNLIAPHEAALLRAAYRLCGGNEDLAQDLVQEALVKGYSAYIEGRFQEGTHVRAWLMRILTNGFITQYNRKQRWEAAVDLDLLTADGGETLPASLHASAADQPEQALLASMLEEPVEAALAALSPELRACVVLVDIEGLDYAEAAAALGTPLGTLRSRLFRARRLLHARLTPYVQRR
jgi:RNA polymerase sigma-70 factor (ECF subfamily)